MKTEKKATTWEIYEKRGVDDENRYLLSEKRGFIIFFSYLCSLFISFFMFQSNKIVISVIERLMPRAKVAAWPRGLKAWAYRVCACFFGGCGFRVCSEGYVSKCGLSVCKWLILTHVR